MIKNGKVVRRMQQPAAPTKLNDPNIAASRTCTVQRDGKEFLPIKIFQFNASRLYSKYHTLADFISENDPDVIAITETWLDKSVSSN